MAASSETLERLLFFINKGIHPLVPSQGSVGASGDLAPLGHLSAAMLGEGEKGMRRAGASAGKGREPASG